MALLALFIINAIYFYPAYSGKKLEQDDIKLGVAKTKEIREYKEKNGEQILWTQAMFSGMPTFQMLISFPNNVFEKIEGLTKLWQPAQIGLILFLMIGFYLLLASYKVNPWLAVIGSLALGFSAFYIISFDAGHNAKIRAAGYMAPTLMAVLLAFRKKYWLGAATMALFLGLAINANHIQITYYSALIILVMGAVELVSSIKQNTLPHFGKAVGFLIFGAVIGLAPNISQLWTTYEYTQETIRGGNSELVSKRETSSGGLDKDYAMSWSYGQTETLNLLIPNIMGGGASQTYEGTQVHEAYFNNIKQNLQRQGTPPAAAEKQANRQLAGLFYWGDQSMVNGANYLGASVFFFFVLGMFLIRDNRRIWVGISIVLALMMAWGKNLEWFNDFLFNYLPLYNKFRVPSMTLTVVFLLAPLMGIWGLDYLMKHREEEKSFIKKSLLRSLYITGGLFAFIALLGSGILSFEGLNDQRLGDNPQLLDMLVEDRKDLAQSSAFRSLIFAGLGFVLTYFFFSGSLKKNIFLGGLTLLIIADLWSFDKQHLNAADFVKPSKYMASFQPSVADQSILQDQGIHYRVFNLQNPFNDANTSYYHHSIGGYHGAKLERYQELFEYVLSTEHSTIVQNLQKNRGQNMAATFGQTPCLNMLNGKYIIYNPQAQAIPNEQALGNAWFVQEVRKVPNADKEIKGIATINPGQTALLNAKFGAYTQQTQFSGSGTIKLTSYHPMEMVYESESAEKQMAVFSEIYYTGKDWQAYIDGEPLPHTRVNYVLRALKVPAGKHTITFKFEPKAYYAGERYSLFGSIALFLLLAFAAFQEYRKQKAVA